MIKKLIGILIPVTLLFVVASCGGSGTATDMRIASANQTVVVTPFDLTATPNYTDWFFYQDTAPEGINNSLGSFVPGPATPPQGSDSVEISTIGTSRPNLATYQFQSVELADITALSYSTYIPTHAADPNRAPYLQFNADFLGNDTWQRRLIFLPRDNGTVLQNTWQTWDAYNGGNAMWRYSGPTWPTTSIPGSTPKSWSWILTTYAGVSTRTTDSWLGIRVGEPYADGFTANIDEFIFGTGGDTTTFDFERTALDHCRDHWAEMGFKNYGQCVSFHKNKGQQGQGS